MAEEIVMTFSPTGETTIKVTGVAGKSCTDLTKDIEDALGDVVSDKKTTEYFQPAKAVTAVKQR